MAASSSSLAAWQVLLRRSQCLWTNVPHVPTPYWVSFNSTFVKLILTSSFLSLLGAVETCQRTGSAEEVSGCVKKVLDRVGQGDCKACIFHTIPHFCQEEKVVSLEKMDKTSECDPCGDECCLSFEVCECTRVRPVSAATMSTAVVTCQCLWLLQGLQMVLPRWLLCWGKHVLTVMAESFSNSNI